MSKSRIVVVAVVVALVGAFFVLDAGEFFSLAHLKSHQARMYAYRAEHPLGTALGFFAVYVGVTGLSLPGAAVMSLAAGAIFGLLGGTLLVSFAATAGATVAFLLARFLFRDMVQRRFGDSLRTVNDGIARDGAFYLFTLRLVPVFPYFVINLVMALTPIRTWTFAWVSQVGMLAATIVFVNAGTQVARLDSVTGILSPGLVVSFTLLGLFPLIAKRAVDAARAGRALRGWPRPDRFDRDVVVVGAGSAGLVSALIAASARARVTLVERERMGGDCLHTGCVPSKALIRTTRFLAQVGRASDLGVREANASFEFADVMERVQRVIRAIEPHDSVERYESLGVECLIGDARIESPYEVSIDGRRLTTRSIVVAAGARPFVPSIPGLDDVERYTSDDVWALRELPARLLVLGGGPVGCELAQAFARLGSRVTVLEMLPRLLAREDPDVCDLVAERFRAEGIDVRTGHRAERFERAGGAARVICTCDGREEIVDFDAVLVAVGRTPNTHGYGLEELGIALAANGTIEVNEYLQTRFPNVLACGDVTGPYQLTHAAAHQAWYAAMNALFGSVWRSRVDYSVMPWATFTEPEVARVGLSETEARERGIPHEVTRFGLDELDRAVADEAAHGFVKVLTVPGRDRILGAAIVGENAGELIAEYVTAMSHRLGMRRILATIHVYPTLTEANRFAAGAWRRAHLPRGLLRWLGRYHAWRRGERHAAHTPPRAGGEERS